MSDGIRCQYYGNMKYTTVLKWMYYMVLEEYFIVVFQRKPCSSQKKKKTLQYMVEVGCECHLLLMWSTIAFQYDNQTAIISKYCVNMNK